MDKEMLRRTRIFIFVVILVFLLLVSRLAYLQIINYEYYWEKAEKNRLRILPITAPRGEIFDRQGRQLVTNRPGFTVSLVDLGSGYDDETIVRLAELLEMEEEEIQKKIDLQYYRRYLPVRLKMDVDFETVSKIAEHRLDLPGVVIEVQPIRYYVLNDFAAHVLGYLGEGTVAGTVIDFWNEAGYVYREGDLVGQAGLEMVWEPFLKGEDGGLQVEVNSTGQAIREFERVEPKPGANLFLTLDASLQIVVEEALHEAVRLQWEDNNFYAGEAGAVVIDPRNGKILAMASIPSYNPNTFSEDYTTLLQSSGRPLVNKTIEEHYPVGSVFKMVTGIAGLEEGVITSTERLYCGGRVTRFGATKSCFRGTAHGSLNIVQAIAKSCNIFFYELGLRVGIDDLANYAREFGFGQPTGLKDIFGEKGGIVASRKYKEQSFNEPWYPAETMDASIGQSFHSITLLQLANYVSMIANGGIHYRPYLVDRVVDSDGNVLMVAEPEVLHKMEVMDLNWEIIREGMKQVTMPGGTASRLANLPVKAAGKTGSAQVAGRGSDIPSHGFFVGYAPADNPEIALVVFIKYGGTGGASAVPVAEKILESYFADETAQESEESSLAIEKDLE
ncbi:MAG: penicillin-binding protein 2 [Firmicutes bacterium]|nr:penicillin-binding protein 2 [Bacillota bacterium]